MALRIDETSAAERRPSVVLACLTSVAKPHPIAVGEFEYSRLRPVYVTRLVVPNFYRSLYALRVRPHRIRPNKLMGRERNLLVAQDAVKYVRSKITIGASNKPGDVLRSLGGSLLCVPAIRSVDLPDQDTSDLKFIRAVAAKAEHVGCGNCGENASLAFVYLLDRGVKPLDLMEGGPVDHAFVLVGSPAAGVESDPKKWGGDAVVCDPWHYEGGAYPATEFRKRMYKAEQMVPRSFFRID